MASESVYYVLMITVQGSNTASYYAMTPTSNLEFSQGAAGFLPTSVSETAVYVYPEMLEVIAPPGTFQASAIIETDASQIAGRVVLDPSINVATVITLYGAGGNQIGQTTVDPGDTSKNFNFPVSSSDAIASGDVAGVLRGLVPPKKP